MSRHASYSQLVECSSLGIPLREPTARTVDGLVKSLGKSSEAQYRHRVTARAPTELNPGERSDVSWITTESVDSYGDVVLAKGMNNSQFQANPMVTLSHSYSIPAVARSIWQKKTSDGDLRGVKAKTRYPERPVDWPEKEMWPSDRIFGLVQAKLLQGKSIGFLPLKWHFSEKEESNKNTWPMDTLVFDEWLLLEYAVCTLPANQDALVQEVSKSVPLDAELIRALGLEGLDLTQPVPPTLPLSGSPGLRSWTSAAEIERAVASAVAAVDFEAIAQRAVAEAIDRARGRV